MIQDIFDAARTSGGGRICLESGTYLFRAGEAADTVYLVRSGMLAVHRTGSRGTRTTLGFIRRGGTVGEMAALADAPHSADVLAVRDTVLEGIPTERFLAMAHARPTAMRELARLTAQRARPAATETATSRVILFAAATANVDATALAHRIAKQVRGCGLRAVVFDHAPPADADWIDRAEASSDYVLLAADADDLAWSFWCRRQADRMLIVGNADTLPPPDCAVCATEPLQDNRLVDLVLLRDGAARTRASAAWLAATAATRLFHLGPDNDGIARLARFLTGRSVGLVLSGGGARAFAHLGAMRALRDAGVPIDLVGGTSMGAIVGAGLARGWSDHELDERLREAFVTSSPLDDIALPIIAMTRGRKVEARLAAHFGDMDIADLDVPFFCISTNLTTGRHEVHDRGALTAALRASIALPGILPPVVRDGHVLVDGGVIRNLPTDIMRARHEGAVIGNDVTVARGLDAQSVMPPASWLRWFGSGAWRRGPPIVSILMRAATISTEPEIAMARAACDVYVMPDIDGVEIRDWRAYPRAVDAGYRAMTDALAALECPVLDLRRRRVSQGNDAMVA